MHRKTRFKWNDFNVKSLRRLWFRYPESSMTGTIGEFAAHLHKAANPDGDHRLRIKKTPPGVRRGFRGVEQAGGTPLCTDNQMSPKRLQRSSNYLLSPAAAAEAVTRAPQRIGSLEATDRRGSWIGILTLLTRWRRPPTQRRT